MFENERKCVIPGSCHSGSFWFTHLVTALAPQGVCPRCVGVEGRQRQEAKLISSPFWFSIESCLLRGPFPDLHHVDGPSLTLYREFPS